MKKAGKKKADLTVGAVALRRFNERYQSWVNDHSTSTVTASNAYPWSVYWPASCQDPKTETILEEAERLTSTEKPDAYDHPADNFRRLGIVWGVLLDRAPIEPERVALMMAAHKLVRQSHKHGRDNLVDLVGYIRCVEKIGDRE